MKQCQHGHEIQAPREASDLFLRNHNPNTNNEVRDGNTFVHPWTTLLPPRVAGIFTGDNNTRHRVSRTAPVWLYLEEENLNFGMYKRVGPFRCGVMSDENAFDERHTPLPSTKQQEQAK